MDNTVVNEVVTLRDESKLNDLKALSEQLRIVLRGEPKDRASHEQIANCFNLYSQYLQLNTLEEAKNINVDVIKSAINFMDSNLKVVRTTADIHDQIKEIISRLEEDLNYVISKIKEVI